MTDPWVDDPATWRPTVPGSECATASAFLSTAARVLEFPGYFGHNWDAFDECFHDLMDLRDGGLGSAFGGRAGRPERRVQLVIDAPALVLRESPDALAILVTVLRTAAEGASKPSRAGFGLTLTAPDELDLDRWTGAGLSASDVVAAG